MPNVKSYGNVFYGSAYKRSAPVWDLESIGFFTCAGEAAPAPHAVRGVDWFLGRIENTEIRKMYYNKVSGWVCFGTYRIRDGDGAITVLHTAKIKALWL